MTRTAFRYTGKQTGKQTGKRIGKRIGKRTGKRTGPARLAVGFLLLAALAAGQAVLPASPVLGQGASAQGFDAKQPIEISADSLEVRQNQQLAVFAGNVQAVQGNLRLRADELTVHYRPGGGAAKGAAGVAASGAIRQLDAKDNVFIASPNETAQGGRAVYDVEKRVITLEGGVVLTRGENVLRGHRMVMNLDTGRSRLEGGDQTGDGTAGSGRVKGLFVPPQKKAQ